MELTISPPGWRTASWEAALEGLRVPRNCQHLCSEIPLIQFPGNFRELCTGELLRTSPPRTWVNSAWPRSKQARTAGEVGHVAGYYEEDTPHPVRGDVCCIGPGPSTKRAGAPVLPRPGYKATS